MIGVDTNLLVYAHRADSPWHERATACIRELAESRLPWSIPWPAIHEYFAIVTHPKIYDPPSTIAQASDQIDAWLESPTLSVLGEADDHWRLLEDLVARGRINGPMVHDARIATICLGHGVTELLTADRDFGRFPQLRVRNPLAGP